MERGKGREIFHKAQDGYNLTCSGLHADLSVYMYIQTCMFFCSATHSSSQTAGSIYAFMWSTAQSRARSQCVCISVYMCVRMHACTHVCVCVCEIQAFPPLGPAQTHFPSSLWVPHSKVPLVQLSIILSANQGPHSQSVYRSRVV